MPSGAVAKTKPVVSSFGIIMAAALTFSFAGLLLIVKESDVALAMGVMTDTFLVRPLLVPAMILPAAERRAADHRIAQ